VGVKEAGGRGQGARGREQEQEAGSRREFSFLPWSHDQRE